MKKLFASTLLLLAFAFAYSADSIRLTIVYTNDLHGYMLPFDYRSGNSDFMRNEFVDYRYQRADSGGLARRAALIGDIREKTANPVLLIDSGDIFTRGPWGKSFLGEPEIEIYNLLEYDAACIGNNEFKATSDKSAQNVLVDRIRESEFPWLCANLTVGDTGVPVEGVRPFVIKRLEKLRIGLLGLTSVKAQSYAQTKGWSIGDPALAAASWIPAARKQCDILIAVTHIGYASDQALAAKVEGIDLIIGGDSHTFLPEIVFVAGPKGVNVPITQAGAYGVAAGKLELGLEKDATGAWRVVDAKADLIAIDASIPEDPRVAEILEYWIPRDDPARSQLQPEAAASE